MRLRIKMDYSEYLLTRDLSASEIGGLLQALDGAVIVERSYQYINNEQIYTSKIKDKEPEIDFVTTNSRELPEFNLRQRVKELLVVKEHEVSEEKVETPELEAV